MNISWAINTYAHHAELVSGAFELINSLLHIKKNSTRHSALYNSLLLAVSLNHGHVHEYHEPSPRSVVLCIPSMI